MSVDREFATALKVQTVPAVFGNKKVMPDSTWEWDLAAHLKQTYSPVELLALFSRYRNEEHPFESQLRRVIFRAMCRTAGHALQVDPELS